MIPKQQMTTTVTKKGLSENVPALSEDAVAVWRRFESVEEEGGVSSRVDEEREGDDEMMYDFHGQPEPVPAEEYKWERALMLEG